jgi:hypothetical protein
MPEQLRVLLPAQLRYYNGGVDETQVRFCQGATLAHYLAVLDIPGHEFMGIVLDGVLSCDLTRVPGPNSVIELVPSMSGG